MKIIDINGVVIKPGMTVKTTQHSGGIFPPSKPIIGIVEDTIDCFNKKTLRIRYRKDRYEFDSFINIQHQINEVILNKMEDK